MLVLSLWDVSSLKNYHHHKFSMVLMGIYCICGFLRETVDFRVLMYSHMKMKIFKEVEFEKPRTCVICWEKFETGVKTKCAHYLHLLAY